MDEEIQSMLRTQIRTEQQLQNMTFQCAQLAQERDELKAKVEELSAKKAK